MTEAARPEEEGLARVEPDAGALVESLRAFGYDLPTAIADLVDNSIAAVARNVWIDFRWNGAESTISLRDDGKGMTSDELLQAMRLGSRSPTEARAAGDLGRFGLGLKTASFSQARLVGVRTGNGVATAELCWDLDLVHRMKSWVVRKSLPELLSRAAGPRVATPGTVVIWGSLDRLVGSEPAGNQAARDHFYRSANEVSSHLRKTFCDYLRAGELNIHINGNKLKAWDPFLERHIATQSLPVERIPCGPGSVEVSGYVLPHHSKLTDAEYELAAGGADWTSRQGFYVFRNRRLLAAGTWLALGFQKERHHELARIRVDLPNVLDEAWQLDVKKSIATPPPYVRDDLKRIARMVRSIAAHVYKHRGAKLVPNSQSEKTFLWVPYKRHGRSFYKLDRDHPLVASARDACREPSAIYALLRVIEETVPTPLISIREAEEPKSHGAPFEGDSSSEVLKIMRATYNAMIARGQSPADALRRLAHIEPFDRFPELLETFGPE